MLIPALRPVSATSDPRLAPGGVVHQDSVVPPAFRVGLRATLCDGADRQAVAANREFGRRQTGHGIVELPIWVQDHTTMDTPNRRISEQRPGGKREDDGAAGSSASSLHLGPSGLIGGHCFIPHLRSLPTELHARIYGRLCLSPSPAIIRPPWYVCKKRASAAQGLSLATEKP